MNDKAIIIGGSIAGLLTARILSDHYRQVIILERDTLPTTYDHRKGVPQSHHGHALLARGVQLLDEFFPGLTDEWQANGISRDKFGDIAHIVLETGTVSQVETGINYYAVSRNFIEGSVRERVLALPNIEVQQGIEVISLHRDPIQQAIAGVWVRQRGSSQEPELQYADLVVNTSGRSSKVVEWLETIGYDRPELTEISAFGSYASRWYEVPNDLRGKGRIIPWVLMQPPHTPRSGVILPYENDTMVVTLIGSNGLYPPTDEAGFEAFAKSLPSPIIYDIIKRAQPLSQVYGYRKIENRMWHFDKMADFPQGLLVLGDAYTALNPLYGQGMTAAAVSAEVLAKMLKRGAPINSRQFQKRLAKAISPFWMMASGEDLRWPAVEGAEITAMNRFLHGYMDHVMAVIPYNPEVFKTFVKVQHGLAAPTALFKPSILLPILARSLRRQSAHNPNARITSEMSSV